MRALRSLLALFAVVATSACSTKPPATVSAAVGPAPASADGSTNESASAVAASAAGPTHWTSPVAAGDTIPVTEQDPVWGDPDAPVTVVAFEDLECPYCARSSETLGSLMHRYGPHDLRIVFKHDPLSMHAGAREAANLGAAIFQLGGREAFFAYAKTVFHEDLDDSERDFVQITIDGLTSAQAVAAMSIDDVKRAMSTTASRKVDQDIALAKALGANGTPTFYINGIGIHGAESEDVFAAVIDDELKEAKQADGKGAVTGATSNDVYARRLAANVAKGRAKPDAEPPKKAEPPDPVVHFVPIEGSPVLGKSTALVTIVELADFDCTACQEAAATVRSIAKKYGDKVRIVFKPISVTSHPRSEVAAELAVAVFKKKGNDAFWKTHDALYDPSVTLGDESLMDYATRGGLDGKTTLAEINAKKYEADVNAALDLADDLKIKTSPEFFINGRRLRGSAPVEAFEALVDSELQGAQALVDKGTRPAAVYDAIMKGAEHAPEVATKHAPAVTRASPSRGPANAPVTIQVFADFQCPFCKKVQPTLDQIEKDFPGKVRIVFREMPLSFHKDAMPAAMAAAEAQRQKGDKGFWAFHDALYAAQGTTDDALKRPALEKLAADLGLDMKAFDAALDAPNPPAAITDDQKIANDLGVTGTPTVLINDFVLVGAQPVRKFERLVRRALSKKP